MRVIVKRPFHIVREGEAVAVLVNSSEQPVGVRIEGAVCYLDLERGALALTPDEFNRHVADGDFDIVP